MAEHELQQFQKGEIVFAEGSMGELAYIVREGEFEIMQGLGGKPVVLRTLTAGEMFGEIALITAAPRSASVVAKTNATLEIVGRDAFVRMLQSDSEFAMATIKRVANLVPEARSALLSAYRARQEGEAVKGRDKRAEIAAFEPDHLQIERQSAPRAVRSAGYLVVAFLIAVGAWSAWAFTDTTVTGTGKIIATVPNITVQPFENGIVRQVNVKEGDIVKRGQVLATLDPTVSEADLKSTQSQLVSTEAQVKRLEAELGRGRGGSFSGDKLEDGLQRQLYNARTQQFQATLQANNEEIRNLSEQIAARREEVKEIDRQLGVLREITRVREDFFKKERDVYQRDGQWRLQYLDAQRSQVQAERELMIARNSVTSLEAQHRTRRAQRDAFVSDWQAKANQELVNGLREQTRLAEQYKKFDRANSLIEITAPADAVVLSVKTRTSGTVLRSAEAFFELVPIEVPLEVEVDISPRDVAQLQVGDRVFVKVDALPFIKHGVIEGRLRLVSEDTFEKTLTGQPGPVFRGRVSIEKSNLTLTPQNFRLTPGMTVTADVRVGTRSLLTYFTYPLLRSGATSFREP